jgi:two-component system, cell cycle sensor histidine kinase and response regulator CckA
MAGKIFRHIGGAGLRSFFEEPRRMSREAVGIFEKTPGIAMVILDLTMPRLDGEQCFRELRQLDPAVKVIMSSGYDEQEVAPKFIGTGLSGFIQKPYTLSALRGAIKSASREVA